jgi:hypothetical protein
VPPRSATGQHIVSRVDKARRLDPSLTIARASQELGISQSSYYKMRAGTRTGQGSIFRRVMAEPTRASGQKQSTRNAFTVTFKSGDRVGSRNVDVKGRFTKADALVLRHDPKFKRAVVKQLRVEEQQRERYAKGSPEWTRKERGVLEITEVRRRVYGEVPSFFVREAS